MTEQLSPWFPHRTHPKCHMVSVVRRNPASDRPDGLQHYRNPGSDWPKKFRSTETARKFADALNAKEARDKEEAA